GRRAAAARTPSNQRPGWRRTTTRSSKGSPRLRRRQRPRARRHSSPPHRAVATRAAGRRDPRSVSGADLIVEQPEEGVERGVEGGDPRAVDPFAVPATVILLVFEEPVDEPIDVRIEPESVRQGP